MMLSFFLFLSLFSELLRICTFLPFYKSIPGLPLLPPVLSVPYLTIQTTMRHTQQEHMAQKKTQKTRQNSRKGKRKRSKKQKYDIHLHTILHNNYTHHIENLPTSPL